MKQTENGWFRAVAQSSSDVAELIGRLIRVARTDSVYSEPVDRDGVTIITASEVTTALGFGFGSGGGPLPAGDDATGDAPDDMAHAVDGFGGGGGGGGFAGARPVAIISIAGDGVRVEPVVDATKLALAALTMVGTMLVMISRVARAVHGAD